MSIRSRCVVFALCSTASAALAASNDNNVEWTGVSHVAWQDRRPLAPVNRQSFEVRFQAYRFDITAARVRFSDAAGSVWVDAVYDRDRGPYAVWKAQLPASASDLASYYIELTDGTDTDYYSVSGMSEDAPVDGGFTLDFATLTHAPLGATPVPGGGAVFRMWAPTKTQVYARGQFNNWGTNDALIQSGDTFAAYVPSAQVGQMYKWYMQPGAIWKPDPRGRRLNPNDNYNTHVLDPFSYQWQTENFQTPPFEDWIIYQLHVGTFAGRNDPVGQTSNPSGYSDVKERVAHLVELGVTAVQFSPFQEFPWDWSGGYNPITHFAPESRYGSADQAKAMIDELHANGIAVTLDIPWNVLAGSDNFMWNFVGTQCYYDAVPPETPWGSQLDFDRNEVREYLVHSALQWLEEFRVDGFRFDATDFIPKYQGSGWSLMQWLNDTIDNRWADKFVYAEELPNDAWVTRPTSLGGAGYDAQYHERWRINVRNALFASAFGDPSMTSIRDAINGTDVYIRNEKAINYIELHDEAWPTSGGQRLVKTIDTTAPHDDQFARGRTTLGFGLTIAAPGVPAILMGTEWLESTPFGSGGPSNNPEERINWQNKTTYAEVFEFYKDLIAVRKSNGGLRANAGHSVHHLNESGNVIGFHRWDAGANRVLVIANFSNNDYSNYQVGAPAEGTWYELVNSQSEFYGGSGPGNCGPLATSPDDRDGQPQSLYLNVPAMGLLVLRHSEAPNAFIDLDQDAFTDACDNCPDTFNPNQADSNGDGVGDACDCNNNGVYDSTDIANGTSLDLNGNGVPDECEAPTGCAGDLNCDGVVNFGDIDRFVEALGYPGGAGWPYASCPWINGDANGDQIVNFSDIDPFVALIGASCP